MQNRFPFDFDAFQLLHEKDFVRQFMENIPGGVYRCELSDSISLSYASDGLYQLTGYSAEEVQQLFCGNYVRLVHPDDQPVFNQCMQTLSQVPDSRTTEYRICRKDGSFLWVSDTMKAVRMEDGRIWGFAVVTDINQSKREQLKLRTLMDTFPGAVIQYRYTMQTDLQVDYMNDSTLTLLGFTQEEFDALDSQDPLKRIYEDDVEPVTQLFLALIRQGASGESVCRLHAKTGLIWVKLRLKIVMEEVNQIYITAVLFDITEEREAQLRRQWNDERYRLLVEGSHTTTLDYDPSTDTMLYSRNIHNRPDQNYKMDHFLKNLPGNPLFDPAHVSLCRAQISALCSTADRCTFEMRLRTCNSDFHWCRVQLVSIADPLGTVYRILGRLDDIQAEKDRESELETAINREETFRSALTEDAVLSFIVDGNTGCRIPAASDVLPPELQHELSLQHLAEHLMAHYINPEDCGFISFWVDICTTEVVFPENDAELYTELRTKIAGKEALGYRWVGAHLRRTESSQTGQLSYLIYAKDIHEKKLEELELRDKASRDPLTGLINRASFEELGQHALAAAKKTNRTTAFFLVDLDDFKAINDTYGHLVGDKVLQEVSAVLRSLFRQTDIVARLGGDELAVILPDLQSSEPLHQKAAAICERTSLVQVDGISLPIYCSIGIGLFPQHGDSFSALYQAADLALYQAKQAGKNQYCIYNEEVTSPAMGVGMNREWLMDSIGFLIYISDVKTHELLYMSKALCQKFQLRSYKGRKCYEVLQGKTEPCDFCTSEQLSFDDFYCWEHPNPQFQVHAILKDKLLNWNGRIARMEIITEIGDGLHPNK